MIVNVNKDEISIIPGVALRPNFNKHQLVHELFHTISSNQHNYFNKDGIAYTKTGTKIDYYDKNLEDYNMNYNPSSDGLNEGITELLASMITNEYTGIYPGHLVVASLLTFCNNQLLNTYFSSNIKTLESFYNNLEEKQNVIAMDDLCKFNSKEFNDDDLIKLIVGALKYNKSYNNEIDITDISNYLDKYYMLDSGSWSNLILESMNKFEENNDATPMNK